MGLAAVGTFRHPMFVDLPYRQLVLVVLCLVPAAVRWWSGRSLLPFLDDPLLPERLLEHRRRNQTLLWGILVATLVLSGIGDFVWTVPLTLVARSAAGFPFRRSLYNEQWSLAGYMSGMIRLLLAFGAFRLLLAFAPAIAASAGEFDRISAGALAALLLFWWFRSADWFRFILRVQPVAEGPLLARFQTLAAKSTAPAPRFEVVDQRGGRVANAVALPSRRGSSVVYSDTLLRLLDADEAAAITAHEIAHLEYYDAARLRTLNLTMIGLIAGATAASLLPRLIPALPVMLIEGVWCVVYVGVLFWTVRDRQRNETASDLRAVQLCGDPEALVRALTKIHTVARVPRRWDTRMEHAATHPSLARRIRAIRQAASETQPAVPHVAPAPPAPETLRSADGRVSVTFADALQWQESEGALHVLPYGQITELRVDVRPAAGPRLVAIERRGRRWDAALDAAEAARAQTILDRIDGRLAEPPPRRLAIPWLQAAGAGVAISAMWAGQMVVAIVAIVASLRSVPAFVAAAGAAALGASALVGRQTIESGDARNAWPALVLAACGAALLTGAWHKRDHDAGWLVHAGTVGLAAFALIAVSAIVMRGSDVVRLYQASVALPSGAILPVALAGALAIRPRRAWRIVAVPVCLVGLMIGVAGSGTFLHAFGRDPFLVATQPLKVDTLKGSPIAEVSLPGILTDLRLSPGGKRMALTQYTGGGRYGIRFSVGAPGSGFTFVSATDLLFLDDDRLLTVTVDGTRSRLQELRVGSDHATWERSVEDVSGARLAYRRDANRWLVTGMDDAGRIVSIEGVVGGSDQSRREWTPRDREQAGEVWAIEGDTALRAQRTFGFDPLNADAFSLTLAAMLDQMETRLTRLTPAGETEVAVSRLDTLCTDHALDGARLVCMAFDGTRTHVIALAPASNTLEPIGSLAGRFLMARPARDGWLGGWRTTSGLLDIPSQVAIDLESRRLLTLPSTIRAEEITAVAGVAATVTHDAAHTRIHLYALER